MFKGYTVCLLIASALSLCVVSSSVADAPAPGYQVTGLTVPAVLEPGTVGAIKLWIYNAGAANYPEGPTLTDTLPVGLEATGGTSGNCSGVTVVTCHLGAVSGQDAFPEFVEIQVKVGSSLSAGDMTDRVSISGGGAVGVTNTAIPIRYGIGQQPGPGFSDFSGWVTNADGTADTQAGSHPYELTIALAPNQHIKEEYDQPEGGEPAGVNVNLPPGIVGEPGAVPECTRRQFDAFEGEECPRDSEIGEDFTGIIGLPDGATPPFPVYNLVPPPGVAAEFGFDNAKTQVFLDARVRSGGDYGITEHASFPQHGVLYNSTTIWGIPGEASHDAVRGGPFTSQVKPFLTLPTSCQEPGVFSAEMLGTWQNPEAVAPVESFTYHDNEGVAVGLTGCERLVHFQPSITLSPDTSFSDTPTGLTATVKVPQGLNPEGLATPGLKETTVALPEGVVVNPGQATGLVACQSWQENIGGEDAEKEAMDGPPSCPAASKVGTDEI